VSRYKERISKLEEVLTSLGVYADTLAQFGGPDVWSARDHIKETVIKALQQEEKRP
jgi:hypothetical protein